jgi:hypothetical protein
MKKVEYKALQKKLEISAIIPPESAVLVARDRTEGMVKYYYEVSRHASFFQVMDYTERLAQSAYLQGVEDAAVAMAKMDKESGKLLI